MFFFEEDNSGIPSSQLSALGVDSYPGMTPLNLTVAGGAVVVVDGGQSTPAWGSGDAVGANTSAMAFPVVVDWSCGMAVPTSRFVARACAGGK